MMDPPPVACPQGQLFEIEYLMRKMLKDIPAFHFHRPNHTAIRQHRVNSQHCSLAHGEVGWALSSCIGQYHICR
jgi:hypothetical protein